MSDFESEIEVLVKQLTRINVNLKKSPFRQYRRSTIVEKLYKTKLIYNEIKYKLELYESDLILNRLEFFIKLTRLTYDEITTVLQTKLKDCPKIVPLKSVVYAVIFNNSLKRRIKRVAITMAAFDIKTAKYFHCTNVRWNARESRCIC